MDLLKSIHAVSLILMSLISHANSLPNETVAKLYHTLNNHPTLTMSGRLNHFSAAFLGKPYILGALGEGDAAYFDQAPLYRIDGFDCETYVDTVLALALASNSHDFKQCLNNIRYKNGQVSFFSRNHFTSPEWNQYNQQQGYLKDITNSIIGKNKQPISQLTTTFINKPSWYRHRDISTIRLMSSNPSQQLQRLKKLQQQGSQLPAITATIAYLPLTALFDNQGQANQSVFNQIPNAAIIEIVRPNWDLRKEIGTHLNVSHLGFAFRHHGVLMFREASSTYKKVIDVPLIDYLKQALPSPTIKGINVQIIVPKTPLGKGCRVINHLKSSL